MYDYPPAIIIIIIIIIMIIMIVVVRIMLFTTMARALRRDRLGLPAKQVGRAHVLLQQGSVCARVRATQYKQTSAFYGSAQKSVHGLVVWSRQGTAARAQEISGSQGGKAPSKAPFQERSFGFQERSLPKLLSSLASLLGSFLQLPSSARF